MKRLSLKSRAAVVLLVALSAGMTLACEDKDKAVGIEQAETVRLPWSTSVNHFYDVRIATKTSNGVSPLPQVLNLRALLELRFSNENSELQLIAQLKDVRLLDRHDNPIDETRILASELELPFGAIFKKGIVTEYRSPTQGTLNSMGFRRQIIAALQLQDFEKAKKVEVVEWDATGRAKVSYTQVGESPNGAWNWTKTGYEEVVATRTGPLSDARRKIAPEIKKAEGRLEFDDQGIVQVTRDEVTRVKVADNAFFSTDTEFSLKRVSAEPNSKGLPSWNELIKETVRIPVGQGEPIKSTALVDQIKRGDLEFDEVLAILNGASDTKRSNSDVSQQATAFRAMVALIRTEESARKAVLDAIKDGSPAAPILLDALGSSSTPFALTVLSQFATSKEAAVEKRARAASALMRAQWPNREALDAVTELTKEPELREHGLLGMGTFIRRFRESRKRTLGDEAVKRLDRELRADITKGKPTTALLAVANSADTHFFDLVLPLQKGGEREVRDAAIQAVRLMEDKRVEPLLLNILQRNDAGDIRAALHAFRPRQTENQAVFAQVSKLALDHGEALVRREAVLVLKKWRSEHPKLNETLEKVRSTEEDKRVLREAG